MIRYRGRVGGGVGQGQSGRSPVVMLLIFDHRPTRTDEEAPRMRSVRGRVVRRRYRPAGVPDVVGVRPGVPATPSPGDRAAIVRGCALDLSDPRTRRRAGERREGPAESWWRVMLDAAMESMPVDEP